MFYNLITRFIDCFFSAADIFMVLHTSFLDSLNYKVNGLLFQKCIKEAVTSHLSEYATFWVKHIYDWYNLQLKWCWGIELRFLFPHCLMMLRYTTWNCFHTAKDVNAPLFKSCLSLSCSSFAIQSDWGSQLVHVRVLLYCFPDDNKDNDNNNSNIHNNSF